MSAREMIMVVIQALSLALRERALDFVVHPAVDRNLAISSEGCETCVSLRSTDGTKIKTYTITITKTEEF